MTEENIKPEKQETSETKKPEEKKAKVETTEKRIEKEFIIPLRSTFKKTVRYKRVPKSIKAIKLFLLRHMKVYDRDLKKIKIDKYLNEFIWARGIRSPPSKVKVKAFIEGDFIRVELTELSEKLKFKKEKLERRENKSVATTPKKKEAEKPAEPTEKTEEAKAEEKEKKSAVVEAGKMMEKTSAKQAKHMGKEKPMQPKRQRRMALQK
jgi:large subunit ribosomal protein L31e